MGQELQELLQEFCRKLDRIDILPGPNPNLHRGYHASATFLASMVIMLPPFLTPPHEALQLALNTRSTIRKSHRPISVHCRSLITNARRLRFDPLQRPQPLPRQSPTPRQSAGAIGQPITSWPSRFCHSRRTWRKLIFHLEPRVGAAPNGLEGLTRSSK
jgi:hypothetical protein